MRNWLPLSVAATLLLVSCVNSCQSGSKLTVAPEGFVITSSESQTIKLTSDSISVVQFKARQTAVTSVAIRATGRDTSLDLQVAKLAAQPASSAGPALAPSQHLDVYQFIHVEHSGLDDSEVQSAAIAFGVDQTWLKSHGFPGV
ncbi:MAG: hypothetical protein O3A47_13785, partial [Chloroflexi bacterium]|nr:hypothetical protein [Chloroflexota bacterium]